MKNTQRIIAPLVISMTSAAFGQTSFAIDFVTDDQGAALVAGSVNLASNEPYRNLFGRGVGVRLSTNNPSAMPLNLYNTEGTGGADDDLERNSTGTGLWQGGSDQNLIVNNVLIINTDTNLRVPNDDGGGGEMTLNFDLSLVEFGFDFIDLDSSANGTITFIDHTARNTIALSFADFENGAAAPFGRSGVAFGDRHANRVLNISATDLGMTSFDQVTFSLLSSGGIGTIYGTTVTPVPEPKSTAMIIGSIALLGLLRRR